jgi:hypothetical protein
MYRENKQTDVHNSVKWTKSEVSQMVDVDRLVQKCYKSWRKMCINNVACMWIMWE